MILKLLPEGH